MARERLEVERKKKEENEKKGVREIKPRELVQGALRALSVGRILLGALVPGVSRVASRAVECLMCADHFFLGCR